MVDISLVLSRLLIDHIRLSLMSFICVRGLNRLCFVLSVVSVLFVIHAIHVFLVLLVLYVASVASVLSVPYVLQDLLF